MNKNIIWLIVLIVLCTGSYFAGKSSASKGAAAVTAGQNRAFGAGAGGQFAGRGGIRMGGGGLVAGQIVAKDATSITVQLRTASTTDAAAAQAGTGSKIVFFSNSTQVSKTTAGSPADFSVGTEVVVQGTPNSDGSVTANTVQIRPAGRQNQ